MVVTRAAQRRAREHGVQIVDVDRPLGDPDRVRTVFGTELKRTVGIEQAPKLMSLDNKYITTGYRVDYTAWECLMSSFYLHNETLNIWTSFLGFLVFFSTALWVYSHPRYDPGEHQTLISALCSVQFMWMGSTVAHIFNCRTPAHIYHKTWFKLDYFGIVVLSAGTGVAYGTYNYALPFDLPQSVYLNLVLLFSLATAAVLLGFKTTPLLRLLVIACFWFLVMAPEVMTNTWHSYIAVGCWAASAGAYIAKFPERYFPLHRFNHLHSHVLWHLSLGFTLSLQYYGIIVRVFKVHPFHLDEHLGLAVL